MRLAIPKILITIPQRLCLINNTNMQLGINEQNVMCCMLRLIMKAWAAGPIHICGAVNINDRKADGLKRASSTVVIATFPPLGLWNPQWQSCTLRRPEVSPTQAARIWLDHIHCVIPEYAFFQLLCLLFFLFSYLVVYVFNGSLVQLTKLESFPMLF